MSDYELTLIFQKDQKDSQKQAQALFKAVNAKVKTSQDWKLRELAYPIAKQTEARYLFFLLSMETESVGKLYDKIKLEEGILRSLIVKTKTPSKD